jgi:hypothetical protein
VFLSRTTHPRESSGLQCFPRDNSSNRESSGSVCSVEDKSSNKESSGSGSSTGSIEADPVRCTKDPPGGCELTEPRCGLRAASRRRAAGCEPPGARAAGCGLRDASCRVRAARCEQPDASCQMRAEPGGRARGETK